MQVSALAGGFLLALFSSIIYAAALPPWPPNPRPDPNNCGMLPCTGAGFPEPAVATVEKRRLIPIPPMATSTNMETSPTGRVDLLILPIPVKPGLDDFEKIPENVAPTPLPEASFPTTFLTMTCALPTAEAMAPPQFRPSPGGFGKPKRPPPSPECVETRMQCQKTYNDLWVVGEMVDADNGEPGDHYAEMRELYEDAFRCQEIEDGVCENVLSLIAVSDMDEESDAEGEPALVSTEAVHGFVKPHTEEEMWDSIVNMKAWAKAMILRDDVGIVARAPDDHHMLIPTKKAKLIDAEKKKKKQQYDDQVADRAERLETGSQDLKEKCEGRNSDDWSSAGAQEEQGMFGGCRWARLWKGARSRRRRWSSASRSSTVGNASET